MKQWLLEHKKIVFLATFLILGSSVISRFQPAIRAQLDQWKLIPQPERFTELYFDDHTRLPKTIRQDEMVTFSFVVNNLEGQDTYYSYKVYFQGISEQPISLQEGAIFLPDGAQQKIDISTKSDWQDEKGKIFIVLEDQQQEIHFAVTR